MQSPPVPVEVELADVVDVADVVEVDDVTESPPPAACAVDAPSEVLAPPPVPTVCTSLPHPVATASATTRSFTAPTLDPRMPS